MQINKIKAAAEIAKTKTSDKRWIAAIDKAVAGVESGNWIVTELANGIMVTTESGETYHANGVCSCRAYEFGQACKHRALARLIEIASTIEETAPEAVSLVAEVAFSSRENLIVEITNIWPRVEPTVHLADALVARFGKNQLSMLPTETLKDIRLALAA